MAYLTPIQCWAMDDRLAGISRNIIENTIRLAKGHLSIIIGLLEPIADEGSFEDMMQRSTTLREVNTLIREVSNGRYSLQDVTILDVRVMLSEKTRKKFALTDNDLEAAYEVFQKVVEMKQPHVILTLQCQTGTARNAFARKICSKFRVQYRPVIFHIRGHDTILVQGFHPSTYLKYTSNKVECSKLRQRLRGQFKAAFDSLKRASDGPGNVMLCQSRQLGRPFAKSEVIKGEDLMPPQRGVSVLVRTANTLLHEY